MLGLSLFLQKCVSSGERAGRFSPRWSFLTSLPNLLQAQSKRPLHEKSTNSLREFFRLFAPVVLLFAALVTLYPNLLADKSELRFRNIWQSFSRITAYFFQRFTFFRQLALSPNVLQAQGKRALQKMATNSLWEFLRLFLPVVLPSNALVALFLTLRRFHSLLYLQCRQPWAE